MTLQSLIPLKARTRIAALSFVAMMVPLLGPGYASADSFVQTNLVSDIPGMATNTDPNLKNPWGMTSSSMSPFWISDNGANVATLYNGAGTPQPLIVTTPLGPTGDVFNIAGGPSSFGSSVFLFAQLSGQIAGWNPNTGTSALPQFTAQDNAAYTGLTIATIPNVGTFLIGKSMCSTAHSPRRQSPAVPANHSWTPICRWATGLTMFKYSTASCTSCMRRLILRLVRHRPGPIRAS